MSNTVWRRSRESGKCPPSLLLNEPEKDMTFEVVISKVVDSSSFSLSTDQQIALDFLSVMEKASTVDKVAIPADVLLRKKALDYRRCVILALVGSTRSDASSLERILSSGYLTSLKSWLNDILTSPAGSVDLLLHMLTNIVALPVTKSIVKESGMGKAIGSLDKHPICKGSPNEEVIKRQVAAIKEAWQSSVKSHKAKEESSAKRSAEASSPTSSKRIRTEESKKVSSFSSLLQKVSSKPLQDTMVGKSAANLPDFGKIEKKKSGKRVKWADHFGGEIAVKKIIAEDGELDEARGAVEQQEEKPGSWSDRRRRDRIRERELLAKAKKAKLMDDDDEEEFVPPAGAMQATVTWKYPSALMERAEVTKPNLSSPEMLVQEDRLKVVARAMYLSENDVPPNPSPLSDVEQALDMTSQAAAIVASIPFFAQPEATTVPTDTLYNDTAVHSAIPSLSVQPPAPDSPATPEFVLSLGLPPYLAGHPVKTLQTLSNSTDLLGTLVASNGLYDQTKLMRLVHTLSASNSSAPAPYQPPTSSFLTPSTMPYGQPQFNMNSRAGMTGGYPMKNKSDDGNLHVAGYGPTTSEAELVAAFSPYVKVDEVVMKSNFSFVNTSDPINAQRAKEALTGTLVGGAPIRINAATRKSNNSSLSAYGSGGSSSLSQYLPRSAPATAPPGIGQPPPISHSSSSVDAVRDDRGNPATKNLFVAGYGPSTTEKELRDLFSQHANVTGVVNKGTFSFVNTLSREAAVNARQFLGGTMLNGGVLRINFAKETGRLGTSFDLTYNTNTGPNAARRNPPSAPVGVSYYGRGY